MPFTELIPVVRAEGEVNLTQAHGKEWRMERKTQIATRNELWLDKQTIGRWMEE
jgi:hypothetical protein